MNNRAYFGGGLPQAVKNILIINVLLFAATYFLKNINWDFLGMYYWQTSEFKLYQVITYMFMHANLAHIFFNMFAVFMFGAVLEHFWGAKKFLFYYFFTGIGAALAQQVVWYLSGNYGGITIGASGAVFGLLLAYGWMFPNEKIYVYFALPVKAKYFVIIYGLMELSLGVANFSGDNVAHFAHLGGMLFGLILMFYWRKKGRLYS
ncbi:conserved membrane hypothetical protein [uncultured Paludibacter sp.]|nr:conserved membrane hypothetical protein [uncultured Paludibacter sp.]